MQKCWHVPTPTIFFSYIFCEVAWDVGGLDDGNGDCFADVDAFAWMLLATIGAALYDT